MRLLALVLTVVLSLSSAAASKADADLWREAGIERLTPRQAYDFRLRDTHGKEVALSGLKGKVVLLNFWATWCQPCTEEMPSMDEVHRRYSSRGLEVVAVNYKETHKKTAEFAARRGYGFTVLVDEAGAASALYSTRLLPVSYLIDRQGRLIGRAVGAREWDGPEAKRFFEEILK